MIFFFVNHPKTTVQNPNETTAKKKNPRKLAYGFSSLFFNLFFLLFSPTLSSRNAHHTVYFARTPSNTELLSRALRRRKIVISSRPHRSKRTERGRTQVACTYVQEEGRAVRLPEVPEHGLEDASRRVSLQVAHDVVGRGDVCSRRRSRRNALPPTEAGAAV